MADHAPDLPEKSHPLLWTIGLLVIIGVLIAWFSHWMSLGAARGREHGPIELPKPAIAVVEPDHLALIANHDDAVLDRGKLVYADKCASCHGPQGNSNPQNYNPAPRNFWQDKFKNANGGGAHALYLVVTNGLPGTQMSAFQQIIKSEDRYAVVHYLREAFVKPQNPDNYIDKDPPKVLALIPPPGQSAEAGPTTKPSLRQVPHEVYPILAGAAASAADERREVDLWIDRAAAGATGKVAEGIERLRDMRDSGVLVEVHKTVRANQRDRAVSLLASSGAQRFHPYFALLSEDDFNHLFANLQRASSTSSAKGAK